jgi:RimJ/RimL family protein N-acetyltransferase
LIAELPFSHLSKIADACQAGRWYIADVDSQKLHIRKAKLEDAPALAEAERKIARIPGRLVSRPDELEDEAFREKIAALSASDSGLYVIIERGGKIAGHAILEPRKLAAVSHVVFLTIAIHEGHQGQGLGETLMRYLVDWAKANPRIEKFELQVRSSNTRAIKLYEKLGFVEEGRKTRRLKYGPGDYQDDLYMALWVGG